MFKKSNHPEKSLFKEKRICFFVGGPEGFKPNPVSTSEDLPRPTMGPDQSSPEEQEKIHQQNIARLNAERTSKADDETEISALEKQLNQGNYLTNTLEPTPEPNLEPIPEPDLEPTPEPNTEPTPEPDSEPTPEPVSEAAPAPPPTQNPNRNS